MGSGLASLVLLQKSVGSDSQSRCCCSSTGGRTFSLMTGTPTMGTIRSLFARAQVHSSVGVCQ